MDKILVIKMRYIGDTVLITPLLNTLKQSFPHARIDALVNQNTQPVLSGHPCIANILSFDYDRAKNFRYVLKFVRNLRKQRYDTVIDLTRNDRSAFFTLMSGARLRIGYETSSLFRKLCCNMMVKSFFGRIHTADHHLRVAEALGLTIPERHPFIAVSSESLKKVKMKLSAEGISEDMPFVIIHPGARRRYKSWPLICFARLADRIIRTYQIPVILSGGTEDKAVCSNLLENMEENAVCLAGEISLAELPALIKSALCLIGNDSAPVHIATAVNTPVIALFGPTLWESWYPRRDHDKVIAAEFPCRPCGHGQQDCPLGKDYCMSSIKIEEVWAAAADLIETCEVLKTSQV
jgi:predicted lipopolysaccharide heptosyltransferase III